MTKEVDPARDCPPCPRCGMAVGTPIKESEQDRWDGPPSATLFCPACGAGWVGSAAQLEQARKSWAAYEAELAGVAP